MSQLGRRRQTLPRSASLKRQRWIRALFDRSIRDRESVSSGCIRIVFRIVHETGRMNRSRISIGFSAGSAMRKAVDRNRVKRLLRESYRLQHEVLVDSLPPSGILTLMILYRRNLLPTFDDVYRDVGRGLQLVAAKLSSRPDSNG